MFKFLLRLGSQRHPIGRRTPCSALKATPVLVDYQKALKLASANLLKFEAAS